MREIGIILFAMVMTFVFTSVTFFSCGMAEERVNCCKRQCKSDYAWIEKEGHAWRCVCANEAWKDENEQ